jgi:endonuclease/exonuclease/phosphatase family metal-dependent hydrolase
MVVHNPEPHRAWLDHIFVSPNMLDASCPVRYIEGTGDIAEKDETAAKASDHYPVLCKIQC